MKLIQSCQTVCDPMDYINHGILQATILEWVAFPFSRGSSQPRYQTHVSLTAGGFFTSWATRKAQILLARLCCLWDLSSPTRDWTGTPFSESEESYSLDHQNRQEEEQKHYSAENSHVTLLKGKYVLHLNEMFLREMTDMYT